MTVVYHLCASTVACIAKMHDLPYASTGHRSVSGPERFLTTVKLEKKQQQNKQSNKQAKKQLSTTMALK